jgi:hypothetical protein
MALACFRPSASPTGTWVPRPARRDDTGAQITVLYSTVSQSTCRLTMTKTRDRLGSDREGGQRGTGPRASRQDLVFENVRHLGVQRGGMLSEQRGLAGLECRAIGASEEDAHGLFDELRPAALLRFDPRIDLLEELFRECDRRLDFHATTVGLAYGYVNTKVASALSEGQDGGLAVGIARHYPAAGAGRGWGAGPGVSDSVRAGVGVDRGDPNASTWHPILDRNAGRPSSGQRDCPKPRFTFADAMQQRP